MQVQTIQDAIRDKTGKCTLGNHTVIFWIQMFDLHTGYGQPELGHFHHSEPCRKGLRWQTEIAGQLEATVPASRHVG